jgi:secreted effector protein SopD
MSVLYRPQENIDTEGTEWQMAESITSSEEDVLRCLNAGSMVPVSQFSFMGYEKTASGVEFTMVHPLISFLQGTYVKNIVDAFSFTEINSGFLKVLNEGYEAYHDNKTEVDTVLKKIHHQHGDTLNISVQGQNRNKLFGSVYSDGQYEMEGNNFSDELNGPLSVVFNKWTDPDFHLSEDTWFAIHDTHF